MTKNSKYGVRLVALLTTATCGLAKVPGVYNNQPAQQIQPQLGQQGATMQPGSMPPGGLPPAELPRPGSVNYVQGQVSSSGQALTVQSVGHFALMPGQALDTGNDGYVEVLLTPGSFLRVGPNSEFNVAAVGLADTRIILARGNALVEVDQLISGTHLEVTFGPTSVDMLKKGLYGFAATPAALTVFDGKADVIGMASHHTFGKNDRIFLDDNPKLKKSGFDETQAKQDPLFVWSAARSRAESDQNKLVAQNPAGYYPGGDGWFWDPYTSLYGFWAPGSFNSPFGFGFYGGFYPGFYHGFYGGFRRSSYRGGRAFVHVHGNGVGGRFRGGGFHGGGFHGGHGGGGHH